MPKNNIFKKALSLCITVSILSTFFLISAPNNKISAESYIDSKVSKMTEGKKFVTGSIIVKFKNEDDYKLVSTEESSLNTLQVNEINKKNFKKDAVAEAKTQEKKDKVKNALKSAFFNQDIEYAQPNYIYEISWTDNGTQATPDDYNMDHANDHWYFDNTNVQEMWYRQSCQTGGASCGGDSGVVVAVIDTGVAYTSFTGVTSEISGDYIYERSVTNTPTSTDYSGVNLYVNTGEIAGNGIDDDSNGYVDDVNGVDTFAKYIYDYYWSTSDWEDKYATPIDTYGHGSFSAGGIVGSTDNSAGSVSPAHNVTLMPIAASMHYERGFQSYDIANAIDYAREQGADVINMSFGGNPGVPSDQVVKTAIDNAYNAGVTLVAASGNKSSSSISYPAGYSNVIAVGSLNDNNTRSYYSNYGNGLDVMAYVGAGSTQGYACYQETLACYGSCDYTNLSNGSTANDYSVGTSFAAPQVAGLAALIKSKNPSATPLQIKDLIIRTANDITGYGTGYDTSTGYGAIDFLAAWDGSIDTTGPASGSILINSGASTVTSTNVNLNLSTTDDLSSASRIEMKVSNNASFSGASWEDYSTSKSWELPYGDGNKTVYVKFRDAVLNESSTYSDSTNLNILKGSVYRFWSDSKQTHFYTTSPQERDSIINNWGHIWTYENVAYSIPVRQGGNCPSGTYPVYLFWSDSKQSHFYTINSVEKNDVIKKWPDIWSYEGIAYCALTSQKSGTSPVYRFWSDSKQTHFYTKNVQEKNDVIQKWPDIWSYEKIAFYVE